MFSNLWFGSLLTRLRPKGASMCRVCHAWPSQSLCEDCVARFAQPLHRCPRCALPLEGASCSPCDNQAPALDACIAAVSYDYPWDRCLIDFKFSAQTGLATPLASLMRHAPGAEPLLDNANWLVPMPLSDIRLRERGYNQALLLAQQLNASKTVAQGLLRIRHTAAQTALPRQQRLSNVERAFQVHPKHAGHIAGNKVLLIDDVMTTGSSLHAAAKALRHAGASDVSALVFARAAAPSHGEFD